MTQPKHAAALAALGWSGHDRRSRLPLYPLHSRRTGTDGRRWRLLRTRTTHTCEHCRQPIKAMTAAWLQLHPEGTDPHADEQRIYRHQHCEPFTRS